MTTTARLLLLIGILIGVGGCNGGPGVSLGDPQLRVLEGDGQVHGAAVQDSLDQPVVAQLYQTADGQVTLDADLIAPAELIEYASGIMTFWLPTPAYAQTNVVGIPGVQVCAVPTTTVPLEPWNPCAVTNSEGNAVFFFEPGPIVGEACAEIRAVVDGEKVVTDVVCAIVEPGPLHSIHLPNWAVSFENGTEIFIFESAAFRDEFGNGVPFTLDVDLPWVVTAASDGAPALDVDPSFIEQYGAQGEIRFMRDGQLIHAVGATLIPGQVPNSWGIDFHPEDAP